MHHQVMLETLAKAARELHSLSDGAEVVREGVTFGDTNNDTEIRADRVLGELMRDHILFKGDPACVSVEGLSDVYGSGKGWWTVDPLDGSLNYKVRVPHWNGLPYTACITVLNARGPEQATFGQIVMAAIADLRYAPALSCVSARNDDIRHPNDDFFSCCSSYQLRGEHWPKKQERFLITNSVTKLDLGSQIVIGEMYYPENREMLARAFAGQKGWLRNLGSTAYEMTLVATGQAIAFICDRQKQHELGAGYLLVKGALGATVDFDGRDLGERPYDFKTQTPVVLAANQAIAEQILELLVKAKP